MTLGQTTWLGHSNSNISSELISQQRIHQTITYDNKRLEAALSSDMLRNGNAQ